ncbi:uncharacterized protein LOC105838908 isoform X2 [Monomorium pharaonis]|uniref:uncharacterized protein LOC105838908 isoform X2 n=1 Tax=Monomorium pharaonis TaxID=307658 RepID=UPI001747CF8C|nr:uncharacterized protein LOC105838908 isoform X2 [Monomorium pharaonis]
MVLEDYKEIVGLCAMYTTMAQMLSGTLICRNISMKGSSKGIDPMPFLGGTGLSILMLRYAWMLDDSNMINVNIFGLLTNVIYMIIYYHYAPNTKEVIILIYKLIIFVVIFLVYAQIEHPANIEYRFGIVVTVFLLLLIAAPLVHLFQNAVGFTLSIAQLSLFVIFPSKKSQDKVQNKQKKKIN